MYKSFLASFSIILLIFVTDIFTNNRMYELYNDKAELPFYERSFITEDPIFQIKKLNRTDISLTLKFTMARDITDRNIMVKISVDKLLGSEFKRTATSVVGNLCKAWEQNVLAFRDTIATYGHLDACGLKKDVTYYLNDFTPDSSYYPKILPFGSYRIILDVFHQNTTNTTPLFLLHWYARVEKLLKF